jgi:hypothetical protein
MSNIEVFSNNNLEIQLNEDDDHIEITWKGKSTDRMPSIFLNPIFQEIFQKNTGKNKKMIMNFVNLDYMNSSTIMSISKFIEKGKNENFSLEIVYNKKRRWQELSFSALRIFQTKDKRIQFVEGLPNE